VLAPLLPKKLFLGAEAQYLSRRTTVTGDSIDPQTLVNATLSTGPGLIGNVELALSVYNLFDVSASDPTSDDYETDRIEQDGRTFMARATVRF